MYLFILLVFYRHYNDQDNSTRARAGEVYVWEALQIFWDSLEGLFSVQDEQDAE